MINADDFYGRDSLARLGDFLRGTPASSQPTHLAMVGFRLARTLSENGAVSRGVCTEGDDGLRTIVEHTGIRREDVGPGRTFSGDEIVSMNCWGLKPAIFAALERQFTAFLQTRGEDLKSEFYLPAAISAMIESGEARVSVLPTQATWFGITYREDKPRVVEAIRQLVAAGEYPATLGATLTS
ncbi:MAG TPA: hypothetical protein VNR00_01170 [Opitutus sp.]|nr:hypothetical protein [Opitutus sp.]